MQHRARKSRFPWCYLVTSTCLLESPCFRNYLYLGLNQYQVYKENHSSERNSGRGICFRDSIHIVKGLKLLRLAHQSEDAKGDRPVDRSGGEYGRSPMRLRCRSHRSLVLGPAGHRGSEPNSDSPQILFLCSSSSTPQISTSTARCGACRVSTMPPSIRSARRPGERSKTWSILRFTNP